MTKPVKSPEILFDIDGTCLDSEGKFNTNLFKAMKTMGINRVNFLTSFEIRKFGSPGEEKSFRCLVSDELKKMGIKTGYVIVNASHYLDFDANNHGKLGNYYSTVIEKFERRVLNFHRKNPNSLLNSSEKEKMISDQQREQDLLSAESRLREKAEDKRNKADLVDEAAENPAAPNPSKIENYVAKVEEELQPKADSFDNSIDYRGGKERMILHIVHHSDLADNFIVFDDKKEVINLAQRMATDAENYPQVYGRMHAVPVFMKDRKQTEDYFIRKLIQGYSIEQLKQFVEAHGNELNDNKQTLLNLLNAIPKEQQLEEKHKGIYAQLVLACWHPHDIENIVELYAKLGQDDELPEELKSLFDKMMDTTLDNPVFRVKVLDTIISNLEKGKIPLYHQKFINQIKDKTIEQFNWSFKDYDWQALAKSISENNCSSPIELLHFQSCIQLGLAVEGNLETDDLVTLMTRVEKAGRSKELLGDLITPTQDEQALFENDDEEQKRYEQEVNFLEKSKKNISKTIKKTASNPQKFLELLRYYREVKSASPQQAALRTYLRADLVQQIIENLTANPPQPWKFLGYPTLREMCSRLRNEIDLLNYINVLEHNYPEGSPAIASLMISLIAGYTNIDFYPADAQLPQIDQINTRKHELKLLLELNKNNPQAIDKIKEKFIKDKDLDSWLFLIEELRSSARSLSADFVPTLMSAIDEYNQDIGNFEHYHISHQAKEVLKRLENEEHKTAITKHAALCALSEVPESFTQGEANEFISRLNDSVEIIREQGNPAAINYAKESAITVTLNVLGRIKGDTALLLAIDDFSLELEEEENKAKIERALHNKGLAESAYLFIKNKDGEIFYYGQNYIEKLNEEKRDALNIGEQRSLTPEQFEKFRLLSLDAQIEPLDLTLQDSYETMLNSYLNSPMACYSFLKKSLNQAFIQQNFLNKIANGKVIEVLREHVNPELKKYLPEQEDQDKPVIKEALLVIAYADHILNSEKSSLDTLVTLAKEIRNLPTEKDGQVAGLAIKAREIQQAAFEEYLNNLTYSKQTEEEIMQLPYFNDNKQVNIELLAVLEAAQTIFNDVTRLPSTKTEVLKSLARTAQACVEPQDQNNREQLQEMGKHFQLKPNLQLLGKAILVLLSTLIAGIGFIVSAAVVVKQTRNDLQFFKALNKPKFSPEPVPKSQPEREENANHRDEGQLPDLK
ncbi:hypothetical protein Lnau_0819 [Legionella nautarum]|uniref:Uncharacterized protein n=1 Tax=Legionella nautarum TaxID=45070 RepID=A0A0W0WU43_9GAMM|nr:hypothetical protein [Legionella nautarum]KTD35835.1 hypothetical protein Lnau_0819 [Legionella nautarum]